VKERRRLSLAAERLTELTTDDLRDVDGGAYWSAPNCVTTATACRISEMLRYTLCLCVTGSHCDYTSFCSADVC
jgi:hypothetical protein